MTPGAPDVAHQVPAGGGQNKPESGTYGEGAALENLKAQLPGMDATQPGQPEALPPMSGGPQEQAATMGLPAGLLAPTRRPDESVATPMAQPEIIVGQGPERRIAVLTALVESPEVSQDTKEWAQLVLRHMRKPAAQPEQAPQPPMMP